MLWLRVEKKPKYKLGSFAVPSGPRGIWLTFASFNTCKKLPTKVVVKFFFAILIHWPCNKFRCSGWVEGGGVVYRPGFKPKVQGGGSVVLVPDRVSYHAEEEGGGDSELRSKDVENAIFLKWDISRIVLSFLLAWKWCERRNTDMWWLFYSRQ